MLSATLTVAREVVVGTIPPPAGVTPNFVNPESIGHRVVISNIICLLLATAVIGLRMYSRLWITHSMGLEDYTIIIGWLLSVSFSIVCIYLCKYGLGVHMWNVPLTSFSPYFLKIDLISAIIYCVCILFIKLSILLLFLRISPDRNFRIAVFLVIVIVVGYNSAAVLISIFSCKPIARSWDLSINYGHCINRPAFYFAGAGLNIGTDIIMMILPIRMLWNLQLPKRQKFALIGIFMAGSFVCIISMIRLRYLFPLISSSDTTYILVPALIWCTLELDIGIICACLPSLKPVLQRHLPKLLGSTSSKSTRIVRLNSNYTADRSFHTNLRDHPVLELDKVPKNADTFFKNTTKTKCNAGLNNESQEEMVAAKSHDITKIVEVSLEYSDAGRSGSRGSTS